MAADTTCADTAARMRKCYEDASGKHYKPMGELDAWHHKHAPQPERELAAQLPLCAVATVASDEADVNDIVTAGNRDCEACHGGPCPRNEDCPDSPDVYREPWEDGLPAAVDSIRAARNAAKRCGIELGEYIGTFGGKPFWVAKTPIGSGIARCDSGTVGFEALPGEDPECGRDCRNWTEQRPDLEIAKHYRQAYDKGLEDGKLPEHPRFQKPANGKQFIGWFSSKGKSGDYWIGEFFGETALIRVPENNLAGHRTVNWLPHPDDFAAALERAEELGLASIAKKPEEPAEQTDSRGVRYEGGRMVSKTGAVRSSDAQHERYDLIGTVGLRRLAETYAEGARKYTDDNWLKGFPVSDILNHTFRHFVLYRAGDRSEDHLAHAAFGLFAAMHYEENNPDCIDIKARLNPDGTVKQYRRWWENPE